MCFCSAYTTKYPIPAAPAPYAMAADTVREECGERTGEYRENEAGKDRDGSESSAAPLHAALPPLASGAPSNTVLLFFVMQLRVRR